MAGSAILSFRDPLKNCKLCASFDMGRCQDSCTYRHLFPADRSSHHQDDACRKDGKRDISHCSHELEGGPYGQSVSGAVDPWRLSASSSRHPSYLNNHLQVATSKAFNTNTYTFRHPTQQQQQPQHQLVSHLPDLQALHRSGSPCLQTWIPGPAPRPGPTIFAQCPNTVGATVRTDITFGTVPHVMASEHHDVSLHVGETQGNHLEGKMKMAWKKEKGKDVSIEA